MWNLSRLHTRTMTRIEHLLNPTQTAKLECVLHNTVTSYSEFATLGISRSMVWKFLSITRSVCERALLMYTFVYPVISFSFFLFRSTRILESSDDICILTTPGLLFHDADRSHRITTSCGSSKCV